MYSKRQDPKASGGISCLAAHAALANSTEYISKALESVVWFSIRLMIVFLGSTSFKIDQSIATIGHLITQHTTVITFNEGFDLYASSDLIKIYLTNPPQSR